MKFLIFISFVMTSFASVSAWACAQRCGRTNDPMQCLTCNAYNEAGNDASIVEVNRTVLARAESGAFPRKICDVIWQRRQFSWTHLGPKCIPRSHMNKVRRAVEEAVKKGSNKKLSFYANYIYPAWARNCSGKKQVGTHIFCNTITPRVVTTAWRNEPAIARLLGGSIIAQTSSQEPPLPIRRPPNLRATTPPIPERRALGQNAGGGGLIFDFGNAGVSR